LEVTIMRDWFAAFAPDRNAAMPETWATRATRATETPKARKSSDSGWRHTEQGEGNKRATRAMGARTDPHADRSVAPVAQVLPMTEQSSEGARSPENQGLVPAVAHVALVALDSDEVWTEVEARDEFSSDISALRKAVAENPQCHSFFLAGEKVRLEASRPLPGEVMPQVRRLKPDVAEYLAGLRIMDGVAALLTGRPERELTAARQAVTAFVDNHLEAARCIGWSDLELFGCYPDREVARNRYDYAGAVTLAAMSGQAIERITELAAHYENGLVYYRKRLLPTDAVPVWEL